DDLDDQEFFSLALEMIDPEIKCFMNDDAVSAIHQLQTETELQPDFIFLDMRMPKMNGADCVKEIRKIERLAKTPAIMYSTTDREFGSDEATKAGADIFFTKPTSI